MLITINNKQEIIWSGNGKVFLEFAYIFYLR